MDDHLSRIIERNTRVEVDKAWETSLTRRLIIAFGTYVIIGGYLNYLDVEKAWLHAAVPAIAYIISTLTLPLFKSLWIKTFYTNSKVK